MTFTSKIFEQCPALETGEELLKRLVVVKIVALKQFIVKMVVLTIAWSKTEETTLMHSVPSRYFMQNILQFPDIVLHDLFTKLF